jgi:putative membrane protein
MRDSEAAPNPLTLLTAAFFGMFQPLLALGQQAQPIGPQQPPWDWPGPWHMWSGGWGFWWIFPLFMLFMVILCIAIFFLGHRLGGRPRHWRSPQMTDHPPGPGRSWGDPTYSALQILNERFAKGEIQKQEYDEKKTAILSSVQH